MELIPALERTLQGKAKPRKCGTTDRMNYTDWKESAFEMLTRCYNGRPTYKPQNK